MKHIQDFFLSMKREHRLYHRDAALAANCEARPDAKQYSASRRSRQGQGAGYDGTMWPIYRAKAVRSQSLHTSDSTLRQRSKGDGCQFL